MTEPTPDRTPTGDLRERLAEALHCPTCGVEPGAHCLRARVDNLQPHMTRVQATDAVLPVVEAALTRARASCCEDGDRTYAEMERHLTQRAEEAEARLRQYDTAIAKERKGRLAAEAAVRRAQALADRWSAALGVDIAHARALREALDAEREAPGAERAAPIDWEAIVRQRERELKQVGEARHQAEAAVRRARELHRRHDCTRHVSERTPVPCVNEGLCEGCGARDCPTLAALDAEQPEETP